MPIEHLRLAARQPLEDGGGAAGAPRGVAVEHRHLGLGEELGEALLHPLGAGADGLERGGVAGRAERRRRARLAAVVAEQAVGAAVVGARQAAVVAAEVLAAGAAEQHRRVAAAVAQQHDLLAGGERGGDLLAQAQREEHLARALRAGLLAQVDEDPLRQLALPDALRELQRHAACRCSTLWRLSSDGVADTSTATAPAERARTSARSRPW